MKTLLLFAFCFYSLQAVAQVSGTVTDENKRPLPGAAVQFFNSSGRFKVALTDMNGAFQSRQPTICIVVSCSGYATDTVKYLKDSILVVLKHNARLLNEVRIAGRQPMLRQETDRTVIVVNDEVKKLADNVLEVINLAPGINISDNEDAIMMNGKTDVQIMINDKIVKMTAKDLAKMLKAMPSGSIATVQVMSNPPSKYDVDGNTGIINIQTSVLPKGFNGNVDYSSSQSTYNWSDLSGILNYGTGKLAVNGYGGWHTGGYLTQDLKTRELTDGILQPQSRNLEKWNDPIFRVTMDLQLSPRSTIGGVIEREASTNRITYLTGSEVYRTPLPDSSYNTVGQIPYVQHWNTYNLNYRYRDTIGNELTADADRAAYARDNHTSVITTGQPTINYHTTTNIDINTFKTDYTHNWKNKLKLEAGFKIADVTTEDDQDGDRFVYHENVRSLYSSLSKNYGKWAVQIGLRAEQTSARGVADPAGGAEIIRPDTNYLNLLPSFYITYDPDATNNFRLSFSRRVKRPDYDDLLPITYELDPLDYKIGNPGLRVQHNDQLELDYTLDNLLSLVSSYTRSGDYFNPVIQQVGNILYNTTANAGTMSSLNFDINSPMKVTKWWNMLNKVNLTYDHFEGQQFQGYLDQGNWHYQVSTTQRLNWGKYLLQFGARYTSAARNLIYYQQSSANTTANISRKLFGDNASIKLGVSDIFKTQRNYTSVNFGTLNYTDLGTFESRRISFSFTWRFGNQKIRKAENHERGDADEKSRSGS